MFREEVEEFFASMDRDFDGRLSFEEFMGEVTEMQSENVFAFYRNVTDLQIQVY